MFFDLVTTGNSEVDTTFTNECGNVGGGEENERKRKIFDERDVKTRVAVELNV